MDELCLAAVVGLLGLMVCSPYSIGVVTTLVSSAAELSFSFVLSCPASFFVSASDLLSEPELPSLLVVESFVEERSY